MLGPLMSSFVIVQKGGMGGVGMVGGEEQGGGGAGWYL